MKKGFTMKKLSLFLLLGAFMVSQNVQAHAAVNIGLVVASAAAATLGIETELRNLPLAERAELYSKNPFTTRINLLKMIAKEVKTNGLVATVRKFKRFSTGTASAALLLALIFTQRSNQKETNSTDTENDATTKGTDQTNQNSDTPQLTEAEQLQVQKQEKIARNRAEFERRAAADAQGNTRTEQTPRAREAEDLNPLSPDQDAFFKKAKEEAAQRRAEQRRLAEEQRRAEQEAERLRLEEERRLQEELRAQQEAAAKREEIANKLTQTYQEASSTQTSSSSTKPVAWTTSENAKNKLTAINQSSEKTCKTKLTDTTALTSAEEALKTARGIYQAPHLALIAAYNSFLNHPKKPEAAKRAAEIAVTTLITELTFDPEQQTKTSILGGNALDAAAKAADTVAKTQKK